MSAAFAGRLVLEALEQRGPRGRQLYRLLEPLSFRSDVLGRELLVPAGTETDFASIPTLVQVWLDDDSPLILRASVTHDWLYRGGGSAAGVSRAEADGVLREGMRVLGAGRVLRWTVWAAVRVFGRGSWRAG